MKTLVHFQSAWLAAIFVAINLPPEMGGFGLPDGLTHMRGILAVSGHSFFLAAGMWFIFRMMVHAKDADVPAAIVISTLAGPIAAEIITSKHGLGNIDFFGITMVAIGVLGAILKVVYSEKRFGLVRLVGYTAAFSVSYVAVVYCFDGEKSWLLLAGSAAIILPETIVSLTEVKVSANIVPVENKEKEDRHVS